MTISDVQAAKKRLIEYYNSPKFLSECKESGLNSLDIVTMQMTANMVLTELILELHKTATSPVNIEGEP